MRDYITGEKRSAGADFSKTLSRDPNKNAENSSFVFTLNYLCGLVCVDVSFYVNVMEK